jgi:hypothetical protein
MQQRYGIIRHLPIHTRPCCQQKPDDIAVPPTCCTLQRGGTKPSPAVDISTSCQQQLNYALMPCLCGIMQGGVTKRISAVGISAILQQRFDRFGMPGNGS